MRIHTVHHVVARVAQDSDGPSDGSAHSTPRKPLLNSSVRAKTTAPSSASTIHPGAHLCGTANAAAEARPRDRWQTETSQAATAQEALSKLLRRPVCLSIPSQIYATAKTKRFVQQRARALHSQLRCIGLIKSCQHAHSLIREVAFGHPHHRTVLAPRNQTWGAHAGVMAAPS